MLCVNYSWSKMYNHLMFIIVTTSGFYTINLAQVSDWKKATSVCGAPYQPDNCQDISLNAMYEIEDFERCGPAQLETTLREYIWRGLSSETTLWENKKAFQRIRIKRHAFGDFTNITVETTVLGKTVKFPVGVSPTVGQYFVHPDGEIGIARAAAHMGTIYVLNSFSNTSMEDIYKNVPTGSQIWMQTYFYRDRNVVLQLVKRAEMAGFSAVVVSAGVIANLSYQKCQALEKYNDKYDTTPPRNLPFHRARDADVYSTTVTLAELKWLKSITKLHIVVKNILTGEDAIQAIEAGASAIYVSNVGGGRVLDQIMPTIDVLDEIVNAVRSVSSTVEVYVDGGVRTGEDVYKALAKGANAVFVGRPPIWGLAIAGEKGAQKVLQILKEEFTESMMFAGYTSPQQLSRSSLIPEAPNFDCNWYPM